MHRMVSFCLWAAVMAVALLAQSFTGSMVGTIRDNSGAVIPGAEIVVINAGTNVRTEARSDANGNYIAPQLPPGQYSIEVSATGFKRFVREGIVIQVQSQARVDITMALGMVSESVVVTADAAMLETTTSSVGKVVDNRRIMNLPLNTRNVIPSSTLRLVCPEASGTITTASAIRSTARGRR